MIGQIARDLVKCTGCGMCAQICPRKSIVMDYDKNGFLQPRINENCIDCGLCRERCPANKKVTGTDMKEAMVGSSMDKAEILDGCTSGGIAFECAKWIVSQNGVVFGARFADDYQTVHHCAAEDINGLKCFKGSKYIQSETNNTFSSAKKELQKGRKVIYIGTPCQIAGLKAYLGKDYDALYTLDFMCHGVMSTRIYWDYLKSLDLQMPIKDVDFRSKENGYTLEYLLSVTDASGRKAKIPWYKSSLGMAFANNIINRASCSACDYACNNRVADITLADYIDESNTEEEKHSGASLVVINTAKGYELITGLGTVIQTRPLQIESVRRLRHFDHPPIKHKNREVVFQNIGNLSYGELAERFFCEYRPALSGRDMAIATIRRIKTFLGKRWRAYFRR